MVQWDCDIRVLRDKDLLRRFACLPPQRQSLAVVGFGCGLGCGIRLPNTPTPVLGSPYLHMCTRVHTHTHTHLPEAPKGTFCVSCSQVDGQAGLAGPDSI